MQKADDKSVDRLNKYWYNVSQYLVSSLYQFQSPRGLSYHELSKATAANQMAPIHRNKDISATTGLPSISDTISHRRNALFGHVARLPDDVPAYKALNRHISLSLGRPPSSQSRRHPGRPRSRWVNQLRTDNNLLPADLWRRLDWIEQCFTSPPTQYRLHGRRFLHVKRPNQQYQSTEGTNSTQTNQTYNKQT